MKTRGRMILALSLVAVLVAAAAPTSSASPRGLAPVSPQLAADLERLDPGSSYGAFVHLTPSAFEGRSALLAGHSLEETATFPSADAVFAVGTLGSVASLRSVAGVTYLEANRRLSFAGDTGVWASRARVARAPVSGGPYLDAGGAVLDGSGVGVAIVDSGIDGTHPDLAGRIGRNFKVVCSTPFLINVQTQMCAGPLVVQEAPVTDTTGGHGTHVAGIVAGDGTASNGTYQ